MIRLEDLQVRAGRFALAIEHLEVQPGEYLMVLGPTASGKTLLLETIAGLRRPAAGSIWFGERDVTASPPERRGVGLVYQDYALFPHLSVAENIGFGLPGRGQRASPGTKRAPATGGAGPGQRAMPGTGTGRPARGRHPEAVRTVATQLGIEGLLDRSPGGLSGGEQQRVALARALAARPQVLLLDEPLSALDGPTRAELRGELARVHREFGATILHVTHDLNEAMTLGERLAVLIEGRVHQVGPPEQVTRAPVDTAVARLAGLANLLPIAGDEMLGGRRILQLRDGPAVVSTGGGCEGPGARAAVIPAEEIEVWPLDGRSSRAGENVFAGAIKAVRLQSVHTALAVEVAPVAPGLAPLTFIVHVLRPQVQREGLALGREVGIHIPPGAVHVCIDRGAEQGG